MTYTEVFEIESRNLISRRGPNKVQGVLKCFISGVDVYLAHVGDPYLASDAGAFDGFVARNPDVDLSSYVDDDGCYVYGNEAHITTSK